MFYIIDLLNKEDISHIQPTLNITSYTRGSNTAGIAAKTVKNNLQSEGFDTTTAAQLIKQRMSKNEKLKIAAIPLHLSPLTLSKYEKGMEYGLHADSSLMQAGRLRTDLAFTLFLSDPSSYEGGELCLWQGDVETRFKLPSGSMVLYPANHLHCVMPINSGSRIAVIGWIQSMVTDAFHRSIIYDLSSAQNLIFATEGKSEACDKINLSISNLLRLWSIN